MKTSKIGVSPKRKSGQSELLGPKEKTTEQNKIKQNKTSTKSSESSQGKGCNRETSVSRSNCYERSSKKITKSREEQQQPSPRTCSATKKRIAPLATRIAITTATEVETSFYQRCFKCCFSSAPVPSQRNGTMICF